MSTGANPTPTFDEVVKCNVKRVLTYWTPITVSLVFLGTFIGTVSLFAYTRAIGRTDLFMAALDSKAPLAVWAAMVMAGMFFQLIVLTGSSWFYGMAVSLFAKARWRIRRAALWLLIPVPVGYAVLIWLGFYKGEDVGPAVALGCVSLVTLLTYAALYLFKRFRRLIVQASVTRQRAERYQLIIFTGFLLVVGVWISLLPMIMILQTYVGEDTPEAVNHVAVISLFTLSLNLVPQLLFFIVKGDVYKKVGVGVVGAIVLFIVFLVAAQGPMSIITNSAAQTLDMRQRYSMRFVLDDAVKLADVDPIQWQSHLRTDGKVQVRAFQLFAFGDLLLLCPASLINAKLRELPPFTPLCIFTRSSQVKRLPPRLSLGTPAKQPVDRSAWRDMADCMMPSARRTESCKTPD